ncbi:hypothetical protein [Leptospira borgpetersenii]|uniref:Uncharacterized protein n=2 Tax=Leptospira borgpetersenii TaxID=174 RepID=A0A0S2IP38_LEPBO|nr:hypothetical protein [Leptospira borgpetersenii]EKQ93116.1 hypothetical protein LEP1GSC101_3683 [Leptospira borgpetersenii str. UI 09149]EKQ98275.1 hypothetical protein LEP1GSC121_3173 [Leptospira borgpetersenii serovar Castellonis str. 200801910]EMO08311.1 hypothetical protein LEP1GSC137_1562 [Leptospira borgpetersenii str. Noumea 25]ALO25418.1 hypothetical protein LBBP_01111 [Leptospira borgpetersenii serovar Ballum]EMN60275.1 hypothetical protein LEP1GSC090_3328 [Leptospira borgpeterseni
MIRGNSYVFALLRALGADFSSQVLGQVLRQNGALLGLKTVV